MLKIFRKDVDLKNLKCLLSEVKKDVLESFENSAEAKVFFEICFVCDGSTLEEEVSKIIGVILDDSEFIFEQNADIIEKFKLYHELVRYLDCLKNLATVDELKQINRKKFNEAQQFFLKFKEFSQDNIIYSQLTEGNFIETFDFEIENDSLLEDKARFKLEEKRELLEKIKSIGNKLDPVQVACEQLNKIFSYSKNISPKRNVLAASMSLKTCPYCNINNLDIIHVDLSGDEKKISAKCELDHVMPQSQFPLFESSFWNLVPICHTCNHNKLEKQIHFNSWFIDISNEITTIDLKYDVSEVIQQFLVPNDDKLLDCEITFNPRGCDFEQDIEILQLRQLYNQRYKSQEVLGDLGKTMKRLFVGLRNFRESNLEELLINTCSANLEEAFYFYFSISLPDYKVRHYSNDLYGKFISEFIRKKTIDEVIESIQQ